VRLAPVPLLVEFWAPDCEPCLTSAVVLDAVAHRLAGEAVVLRLDVEENPLACEAYGILAVPTLALFSEGQERGRRIGPPKVRELEVWIRAAARPVAAA
jgi:thioredoxin 1